MPNVAASFRELPYPGDHGLLGHPDLLTVSVAGLAHCRTTGFEAGDGHPEQ